jgi:hypothetical protein
MSNLSQLDETVPVSNIESEIRVGKLNTLEDVRNELARLYRAARKAAGPLPDAATAARLGYLLSTIGRSLEGVELEKRIEELEKKLSYGRNK